MYDLGSVDISTSNAATQCHEVVLVEGVNPTGIEIGSGTYGRVFEVDYEGTLCIAKELHEHMAQSLDEETFLNYCHIMSTIHHPHIIQFLGLMAKYALLIVTYTLYISNRSILF